MQDVLIRRCTLRVVRRGGSRWGTNRRVLLERATAALPALIAERLAGLLEGATGEIVEPIRLRLAARAAQLADAAELARIVAAAIRPGLLPPAVASPAGGSTACGTGARAIAADGVRADADGVPSAAHAPPPGPRAVLARWHAERELWQRLQAFSERALELWLRALLEELPASIPGASPEGDIERECAALARALPPADSDSAHVARARLVVAVELAERHAGAIGAEALLRALDAALPVAAPPGAAAQPGVPPHRSAATAPPPLFAAAGAPAEPQAAVPAAKATPARRAADVALCSVLPFIALGALHRLGWCELASAAFRAIGRGENGSAFAAALAYKLLPAPQRGWHRSEDVLRTAAVFAGLPAAPSALALERWSRAAAGALSPLDGFIADALVRGHDARLPLLVTRVDSRCGRDWLLLDADGGIPAAWERDEAALARVVRRFGPAVILVSTAAATPALLRSLVAAGRSFVTTAVPGRGDEWRRLRGTGCWVGGAPTGARRLLEAAALLPELEAQALSVNRELLQLRPVAAAHASGDLDVAAALAAAAALGALAWTLWHERETVHPLLALQRFATLDGRARIGRDAVEVRPAYGRRYRDLDEHGLLADVTAPPWLGGRRIVFVGP